MKKILSAMLALAFASSAAYAMDCCKEGKSCCCCDKKADAPKDGEKKDEHKH